jgi:hypothetical protein
MMIKIPLFRAAITNERTGTGTYDVARCRLLINAPGMHDGAKQ